MKKRDKWFVMHIGLESVDQQQHCLQSCHVATPLTQDLSGFTAPLSRHLIVTRPPVLVERSLLERKKRGLKRACEKLSVL